MKKESKKLESIELVTLYIEKVWNQGDYEALRSLAAPEFEYCLGGMPPRDLDGMCEFIRMTREAFPDWKVTPVSMVSDASAAAVRWQGRVTHLGPFHGIPPTGKKIFVSGINFYEIKEGKIVREWEETNSLGILRQMGVFQA